MPTQKKRKKKRKDAELNNHYPFFLHTYILGSLKLAASV